MISLLTTKWGLITYLSNHFIDLQKTTSMSSDKEIIQELRQEIIELKSIIVQLLAEIKDLKHPKSSKNTKQVKDIDKTQAPSGAETTTTLEQPMVSIDNKTKSKNNLRLTTDPHRNTSKQHKKNISNSNIFDESTTKKQQHTSDNNT